jgi:iron complex transport system substrate-binding protein
MGDRLATTHVSVLRVSRTSTKIYTLGSFAGGVLRDAGLRRPANQDLDGFATEKLTLGAETEGFEISPERLREADGDVLFVVTQLPANQAEWTDQDRQVRANTDTLKQNPLWSQLAAAKNNKVFEVGKSWNGESLVDANKMLDDINRLLLT